MEDKRSEGRRKEGGKKETEEKTGRKDTGTRRLRNSPAAMESAPWRKSE